MGKPRPPLPETTAACPPAVVLEAELQRPQSAPPSEYPRVSWHRVVSKSTARTLAGGLGVVGGHAPRTPRIKPKAVDKAGPLTTRWEAKGHAMVSGDLRRLIESACRSTDETPCFAHNVTHHVRTRPPRAVYTRTQSGELRPFAKPLNPRTVSAEPIQPRVSPRRPIHSSAQGVRVNIVRADFTKFLDLHKQEWLVSQRLGRSDLFIEVSASLDAYVSAANPRLRKHASQVELFSLPAIANTISPGCFC